MSNDLEVYETVNTVVEIVKENYLVSFHVDITCMIVWQNWFVDIILFFFSYFCNMHYRFFPSQSITML